MARLKFGPWGALIGKLGNTVGYIRKGVATIRMRPHPSKKKRTAGQKATTRRFQLVTKFIATMGDFVNVGYDVAARNVSPTAQNLAVSYNIKNAITGEYPDQEIDYTKVRICEGVLPLPANVDVILEDNGAKVKFLYSWEVGPAMASARRRDQVMMLVYLPEVKKSRYLDSGARRSEGHDFLEIEKNHGSVNHPIMVTYGEAYIAFVANDRNSVTNSYYCGRFEF